MPDKVMENNENENENENNEQVPNILTLQDEEGQEHLFELIDTKEVDGETYTALIPYFESDDDMLESDSELLVLKVMEENGEEFLNIIENEDEFNKVTKIFIDDLKDLYEIKD